MINLWASWSGPSVDLLAEFMTVNRMYRRRDVEMITISIDSPDRKNDVLSLLKRQQASCWNYIFDSEEEYPLKKTIVGDLGRYYKSRYQAQGIRRLA